MLFDGATLKLQWAEKHIAELEQSIELFSENNRHRVGNYVDPETGHNNLVVELGDEPPIIFSLLVADVVHNLRVALDHANWELRGLDGGEVSLQTKLPVHRDEVQFKALCGGIRTPTGDLPEFFKALEFYAGGKGELIWFLHDLDNEYKHRTLPLMSSSVPLKVPAGDNTLVFRFGEGPPLPPTENDLKPRLDIAFGDIGHFRFKPVVETLNDLADEVREVIWQFHLLVEGRSSTNDDE